MQKVFIGVSAMFMVVVSVLALALSAAYGPTAQVATVARLATPEAAVQAYIDDIQHGDLDQLLGDLLPAYVYKKLRGQWPEYAAKKKSELDPGKAAKFAKRFAELTAPGAKKALFKELQPKLKKVQNLPQEKRAMMAALGGIVVTSRIRKMDELDEADKAQLTTFAKAALKWASETDWGSESKARKAVGIIVETARALPMRTLPDFYDLSYDQAFQCYSTIWTGLREVLNTYGLSIDDALNSVQLTTLRQQGDEATVKATFTVFGAPIDATIDMVKVDGQWYSSKVYEELSDIMADEATHGDKTGHDGGQGVDND